MSTFTRRAKTSGIGRSDPIKLRPRLITSDAESQKKRSGQLRHGNEYHPYLLWVSVAELFTHANLYLPSLPNPTLLSGEHIELSIRELVGISRESVRNNVMTL